MKRVQLGAKGIPYLVTHDGRTLRYPDPAIRVNDTIKLNLHSHPDGGFATTKGTKQGAAPEAGYSGPTIESHITFATGTLVMCTGGRNIGRVGTIVNRERHDGGFDIVHLRDSLDREYSTRISNVFVLGDAAAKPWVSLPKGKGIKLSIAEERDVRRKHREKELRNA